MISNDELRRRFEASPPTNTLKTPEERLDALVELAVNTPAGAASLPSFKAVFRAVAGEIVTARHPELIDAADALHQAAYGVDPKSDRSGAEMTWRDYEQLAEARQNYAAVKRRCKDEGSGNDA